MSRKRKAKAASASAPRPEQRRGAPSSVGDRTPRPTTRRPAHRAYTLLALSLVAAAALCVYGNSLRAGLVYDDVTDIVQNKYVRTFDVVHIFTDPSWATWVGTGYAGYRPVTTLTFAVNHLLHGLRPFGYHAVNVALHAAVSVLLTIILGHITKRWRLACLAGLLFALHPVHADAVASVAGRAEALAALCALGAWWALLESRPAGRHRTSWLSLAALLVAAGTLAKESAATIVPAIMAVDALSERGDHDETGRRRVPGYAFLLAGLIGAIVLRTIVTGGVTNNLISEMDNPLVGKTIAVRLWTTFGIIAQYARILSWPVHLSADYSYRQVDVAVSPLGAGVILGMSIAIALPVVAVWARRRAPDVSLAVVMAGATSILAIAATALARGPLMAERLMYLPSAGFCLLLASAADRVWGWRGHVGKLLAGLGVATLVIGYAARTASRNSIWHDPRTFAEALVADAPRSARSHRELGLVYSELGDHDKATAELVTSRSILPSPATSYDLGNVLLRTGRYQDAARAYQEALATKPDFVEAMTNLGNAHSAQGDEESAEVWFRRALAVNPDATDPRGNLANSLLRRGRLVDAAAQYGETVKRDPRSTLVRINYGVCLDALGRPREAAEHYRIAIALDPGSPQAHVRLVAALLSAGLPDEARSAQVSAERLFPRDPGVQQSGRVFAGG